MASDAVSTAAGCSYTQRQGTRFFDLVMSGKMQVVKGQYFEDRAAQGLPIQQRQDIPEHYVWSGPEVARLWVKDGHRFLCVVSYAWLSTAHPDPELYHLARLRRIIQEQRSAYASKDLLEGDLGVIMDFCSMYQRGFGETDQRTDEQLEHFKECLREINTPYGHVAVTAWQLKGVPSDVRRKYDDRGWTHFESRLIAGKAADPREPFSDSNRMTFTETFDPSVESETKFSFVEKYSVVAQVPITTPARFEAEMAEKGERAAAKGVTFFTNGLEDYPFVLRKYNDAFNCLLEADSVIFSSPDWGDTIGDQVRRLAEALPHYIRLNLFTLEGLTIDDECVDLLVDALASCKGLQTLVLNVGLTDHGCQKVVEHLDCWPELFWINLLHNCMGNERIEHLKEIARNRNMIFSRDLGNLGAVGRGGKLLA